MYVCMHVCNNGSLTIYEYNLSCIIVFVEQMSLKKLLGAIEGKDINTAKALLNANPQWKNSADGVPKNTKHTHTRIIIQMWTCDVESVCWIMLGLDSIAKGHVVRCTGDCAAPDHSER